METSYEDIIYSVKRRANIITREELQFIGCDEAKHVETNMGNMPLEDYYDIVAMQHGYDSFVKLFMTVMMMREILLCGVQKSTIVNMVSIVG